MGYKHSIIIPNVQCNVLEPINKANHSTWNLLSKPL